MSVGVGEGAGDEQASHDRARLCPRWPLSATGLRRRGAP
ncbi:Hypothetical protein CAP_5786 [Chondromyces apiculatus DSM 436]|uniref:Uncharacterized protein n=1 Tax=Chondromyces apiculatus DSM 436 TaxID=1192034 RepID=A0A017T2Q4_9BACT|nr:Hypothetical protein CAP_5786 [Chondromyces apiculatus DSM 436]